VASIVLRPSHRELLVQNASPDFVASKFGDPYEDGECAGWDEMIPTIIPVTYTAAPWRGLEAPDHGEVWALPWAWTIREDEVHLQVEGVRFPYRIEKRVQLDGSRLTLHYRVSNLSGHDLPLIWAAHPLFQAVPGMRLIVPTACTRIINNCNDPRFGAIGSRYGFPQAALRGGEVDLSVLPPPDGVSCQKYYFAEPVREGRACLAYPDGGPTLTMTWPAESLPYLGVWVNEGCVHGQHAVALEPATGGMDDPVSADRYGMGSLLRANQTWAWWIALTLD
jgi:galactose mutarotase-like enzyme